MKTALSRQHLDRFATLFLLIFIFGCSTFKSKSTSKNSYSILMADYYRTYKSDVNKYKYFSITSYDIENLNMKVYTIIPEYNKAVLGPEGDAYYPKDYMQFKDKFFFIEGEITETPSEKVFTFFKERNLIDSTMYKVAKDLINYEDVGDSDGKILTDSKIKVATYVVCKNNNKIIRKWRSNKSEGFAKNLEKAIKKGCD